MGFSIAAPVGPIGMLCIRRTLSNGMLSGFVSGAGAATADGTYGMLAALGLASVTRFMHEYQFVFHLLGGLFLLYLGCIAYKSGSASSAPKADHQGLLSAYASTFALTITNPMTFLSFAALFAVMGAGSGSDLDSDTVTTAAAIVAGVFIGSLLWWLILSSLVSLLRKGLSRKGMIFINKLSGLVIIGFGIVSILSVI